ncbi:juvenile hormone acid O-methyltransferase [Rhipicephalus sanguineus]|uniref:juvenile hormone acid O-methyltransferase n=1 Tax=Rhipicephalus sanguineus TaxID=34632 RepID=UPI0018963439|nr:juvenile hormone acid O-methyltransferase [Rhipicephalus sanguineus]
MNVEHVRTNEWNQLLRSTALDEQILAVRRACDLAGDSIAANFFKPEQFVGDKQLTRLQSRWVLDFCQKVFSKDADETQQFLDVGCGIGDMTKDLLLPLCLPCRRIVGVDLSGEMVEHAERHFRHDKLAFAQLDIASEEDVTQFVDQYGLFDRVYSFNCLVWVRDQARALKNIARLLKPRGECLLVFHASMHALDVNRSLVEMERWGK